MEVSFKVPRRERSRVSVSERVGRIHVASSYQTYLIISIFCINLTHTTVTSSSHRACPPSPFSNTLFQNQTAFDHSADISATW
jgi:hypothetical protein